MNRLVAYTIMILAVVIGGGSLFVFGVFLLIKPIPIIHFDISEGQILLWNGLLSILFFIQHSGIVRTSFRTWLAPIIARHYHPSTYDIASGIALTAVVFLWQPSQTVFYQAEGLVRLLARAISVLAIIGFTWGVRALGNFDTFGLVPLKVHLRGKQLRPPNFTLRGPYLWIRHPLYFFMLVLIWSAPDVSSDRLFFNILWTLWVVVGADTYAEVAVRLLEILFQREGLPDGLWVWDDLGYKHTPFMSTAMYRELIMPAHKKFFGFAHSRGLPVVLHCDGFVEALIPSLIEAGIDCLQPIEIRSGMDLLRIKKNFGERIALIGGMDERVLETNDLAAVDRMLEDKLPGAMAGSGYVLQVDHSVSNLVRYETYRHFVDRGLELGRYNR